MLSILITLLTGALAGYLAGKIMNTKNDDILTNIILGLIGGIVGSLALGIIGISGNGLIGGTLVSGVGACLCIYIYRKIKALVMTVFIVFLFLFILIFPLFGNKIVELVTYVNLNAKVTEELKKIFDFLQGPFALFIIFLFIKIIYAMAPDVRIPSKNVNYGAIFTSIGWLVITWIYSFYINHYAHYSVFYGGLANLVILLLWFYLLANIFVIGMALNYRKSETKKIK